MQEGEDFYATGKARRHMWDAHRVTWEEVCDALEEEEPPVHETRSRMGEARYVAHVQTSGGRALMVVLAEEADGMMRAITAMEPRGRKQKRRFGRSRR